MKTTDGGINWIRQSVLPNDYLRLYGVSFANALTGIIVGEPGSYITSNGGSNWVFRNTGALLHSVKLLNPSIGYAAGFQSILRTTDGGYTWQPQVPPVNEYFRDVSFVDTNTGWVAGRSGTILHTTNGGIMGIEPIGNEVPQKFYLYQNYPNPFNPATKIKFDVIVSGPAFLSIHDILGRKLITLVNESLKPGIYEVEFNGTGYPSGIYFYRLETENYTETKKMILLK